MLIRNFAGTLLVLILDILPGWFYGITIAKKRRICSCILDSLFPVREVRQASKDKIDWINVEDLFRMKMKNTAMKGV